MARSVRRPRRSGGFQRPCAPRASLGFGRRRADALSASPSRATQSRDGTLQITLASRRWPAPFCSETAPAPHWSAGGLKARQQTRRSVVDELDTRSIVPGPGRVYADRALAARTGRWESSPRAHNRADALGRGQVRAHAGGGVTRIDVLDDGEIVATFVPITGRDEILYEVHADESQLRPAV
jgi:hypothetical protein